VKLSKLSYPATAIATAALILLSWSLAGPISGEEAQNGLRAGAVSLTSIGTLEMGPDGVLFVADSEGAAVYALKVRAAIPAQAGEKASFEAIPDLDSKIAGLLGVGVRDVRVQDMAVDEADRTVYLSVLRGQGEKALPVLMRVSLQGEVSEVSLSDIRHARLPLKDAPGEDAKLYRWESRTFTVTDLEYIDGELFIAGLSNEEFASVLRRTPFPFRGELATTGLEIYHGAHGAWETFAPIFSFIPQKIDGKQHLLAGYLCTPLVTFPLDEVRSKNRLRGKTIAELGWGNIPTDMVPYRQGDEEWVLIANGSRGTMKFRMKDIEAAQRGKGISTGVGPRVGVEDHTVPIGTVSQLAALDDETLVILGRDLENGALHLQPRPFARL